jgi:hypothetical protein
MVPESAKKERTALRLRVSKSTIVTAPGAVGS